MVWEDEVTQREAFEIADRVSGKGEVLAADRGKVSLVTSRGGIVIHLHSDTALFAQTMREAMEQVAKDATTALAADPQHFESHVQRAWADYVISIHFLGENALENAKRLGYLDARELYPDQLRYTLEDFAKELYAMEDPRTVYTGSVYRNRE